jgi:hypothetical protein
MKNYFTLIYIKTNKLSDEKFCVGLLANFDGVPYFGYSPVKLNIALKYINSQLSKSIKRSFKLLDDDVNKFVRGEEPLSLFDMPYSKKILDKLTLKKRGIIQYSNIFETKTAIDFSKLFYKYVGHNWQSLALSAIKNEPFRKRFFDYVNQPKFKQYSKKYKLTLNDYPNLIAPLTVDLIKKDKSFVVFNMINITASPSIVQRTITNFMNIINALNYKALSEGLSKGRYYLVYDDQVSCKDMVDKINKSNYQFELIKLSEMRDKI